ncbi:hypothetical protein JCM19037_1489 [Geomicrobium sp. JCM 19037]|uniref:hypothetical protein n=1 Tax=Geomicrobium sp. JCM 19037 TaxID=1460634 RepID=UPI00045F21C2|nr:hypothetical protein [Geomicrobium sp. JCM 19037]GAK03190.1 hypothetical protein JCM19037_1489 [Geomicrobium sp. JCM 19037]
MNTFDQVMDWLQSARKFGVKPGLDRMELVLSTSAPREEAPMHPYWGNKWKRFYRYVS